MNPWLFILPNNPGDVVMALQAMQIIHLNDPEIEIHFLVDIECVQLTEAVPFLAKVHVLERLKTQEIAQSSKKESLVFFTISLETLLSISFQRSINWFQGEHGFYLQALIDAQEKCGPTLNEYGEKILPDTATQRLHSIPVDRLANHFHSVDHYLEIAGGFLIPPKLPPLWPTPSKKVLGRIGIQMGSAWQGKMWPMNHWIFSIAKLIEAGYTIQLFGSPQEKEIGAKMETLFDCEELENQIGKTQLRDLPHAIATCEYFISGDTLAMHLAAAMQIPVISLFGPSSLVETGPYGEEALSLCGSAQPSFDFNNPREMTDISPLDLLKTFFKIQLPECTLYEAHRAPGGPLYRINLNQRRFVLSSPTALPEVESIRKQLLRLEAFQSNPSSAQWEIIEKEELLLSEKTSHSSYAEKYRFHLNALPLEPFHKYLNQRKKALYQWLEQEETLIKKSLS